MAQGGGIRGLPVALIAAGGVLVWSGVENEPVTAIFRGLARGKPPAKGPPETYATPAAASDQQLDSGNTIGATATGSAIANDAMQYNGHCYLYGGAPGPQGTSCWDCSSFVNWVLGHDLGYTLPGGLKGYDGATHGPNTLLYLVWGSSVSRKNVAAGDLCVWQTHMGIAISNTQLISAQDPAAGTGVASIDGTTESLGQVLFCRRISEAGGPPVFNAGGGPH
jgi:cell wall-associated NlpC family hydrolase